MPVDVGVMVAVGATFTVWVMVGVAEDSTVRVGKGVGGRWLGNHLGW